jgi:hypothetical protein
MKALRMALEAAGGVLTLAGLGWLAATVCKLAGALA